jgi:alkanesulfonate monooxygenase SsuD/methylene tetrahydromethanopterin reductase-like flavin-dependent oxidoreductase (luciferase family)
MKYGFVFPKNDVVAAVEMVQAAEAAGWDGYFVWDAPWATDPWVTLGAIAATTDRIRIGTMITPPSRRRPWTLAAETATVDRLSGGRLILSVGLGEPSTGFDKFGEVTDRRIRAELMDEALEIITGLWQGQPFGYEGTHYQVQSKNVGLACPPPVQQPRIPIWVVGAWPRPKSMARALRYDGLLPNVMEQRKGRWRMREIRPDDIRAIRAYVEARRTETTPFDIVVEGTTPGDVPDAATETVLPWADAGATWWIEAAWNVDDLDAIRQRITQGPPPEPSAPADAPS